MKSPGFFIEFRKVANDWLISEMKQTMQRCKSQTEASVQWGKSLPLTGSICPSKAAKFYASDNYVLINSKQENHENLAATT